MVRSLTGNEVIREHFIKEKFYSSYLLSWDGFFLHAISTWNLDMWGEVTSSF